MQAALQGVNIADRPIPGEPGLCSGHEGDRRKALGLPTRALSEQWATQVKAYVFYADLDGN